MYKKDNIWFWSILSFLFWYSFQIKKNLKLNSILIKQLKYFTIVLLFFLFKDIKNYYKFCSKSEIFETKQVTLWNNFLYYRFYCKNVALMSFLINANHFAFQIYKTIRWLFSFRMKRWVKQQNRWVDLWDTMTKRQWREIIHPSFLFLHEADLSKLHVLLNREELEFENYSFTLFNLAARRIRHLDSPLTETIYKDILEKDYFQRIKNWKKKHFGNEMAAMDSEFHLTNSNSTITFWNQQYEKSHHWIYHHYRADRLEDKLKWLHYSRAKLKTFNNVEKKSLILNRPHRHPAFLLPERHYAYWKILWNNWYNTIFHQISFLNLEDCKHIYSNFFLNFLLKYRGYFKKYIVVNMGFFKDFSHFSRVLIAPKTKYISTLEKPHHKEIQYGLAMSSSDKLQNWSPFGSHFIESYQWVFMRKSNALRVHRQNTSVSTKSIAYRWNEVTNQFEPISVWEKYNRNDWLPLFEKYKDW